MNRALYLAVLIAATIAATALLLHVVLRDRSIPVRPVACVQHALPDRGLPACDGGYLAQESA